MERDTVRTVPPWVIQRPPQAKAAQHNHSPSDASSRKSRAPPGSRAGADSEDNAGEGSSSPSTGPTTALAVPTTPVALTAPTLSAAPATPETTATTAASNTDTVASKKASPRAGAKPNTPNTPDSGSDPAEEGPVGEAAQREDLGRRLSHMFKRKEGRKWDHLRSAEPVIVPQFHVSKSPVLGRSDRDGGHDAWGRVGSGGPSAERGGLSATTTSAFRTPNTAATSGTASGRTPWWYNPESQWHAFIQSSRYPHIPHEKSEVIDDEEMQRLNTYEFGTHAALSPQTGAVADSHMRKGLSDKPVWMRVWHTLLHHPLGPLACRLTVLSTSIVALVVAVEIFQRERLSGAQGLGTNVAAERTQVIVAIVVDVVAVPYIGYITADDYTGKPLGLRPTNDRIRLILMDLFFIIFKSASTALGFEAMIFNSTDTSDGLLRALGAFELIGLVSWALTLTINVFREIERLGG